MFKASLSQLQRANDYQVLGSFKAFEATFNYYSLEQMKTELVTSLRIPNSDIAPEVTGVIIQRK